MVKREDIKTNDSILFYGKYSVVDSFVEYDEIHYAKLHRRGILVPLSAIWKGKNGLEVT